MRRRGRRMERGKGGRRKASDQEANGFRLYPFIRLIEMMAQVLN